MPIIINGNNTPTAGAIGYGNGTELAFSAAGSAGNILVSGGSSAPTWSALGSGVATWLTTPTSANLAAAVTDETGSGSLVFANSPSLTTPTIATSATVPLVIGGTSTTSTLALRSTSGVGTTGADIILQVGNNGATEAMRVLNSGFVGIGTNNPLFKSHVYAGNSVVTNTIGQTLIEAQSIETPSAANQRLGIFGYGSATDTLKARVSAFSSAAWTAGVSTPTYLTFSTTASGSVTATEQMRIDASGNVGIGTTVPGDFVHAEKNQDSVTRLQISNKSTGTSAQGQLRIANSGSGQGILGHTGASFTTSGVARQDGTYLYSNGAGGLTLYTGVSQPIYFGINNAEQMRLDTAGNLGIGGTPPAWFTTSNTKVLQLGGSAAIWGMDVSTTDRRLGMSSNLYINSSGNFIYTQTGEATLTYQNAGQHYWYNSPSGTGGTAATVTERMRLNSSGELCVATTTSAFSAANRGNITIGGTTSILSFRANGVNAGYIFHDGTNMLFDCQTAGYLAYNTNSSERMRITSTGNIGMGTASPQCLLHVAGQLSAVTQPTLGSYANSHFVVTQQAGLYGLNVGVSGNGDTWMQTQRFDMATAYNLQLNPAGGNVGIGTSAPAYKLHVRGSVNGGVTTYNQNSSAGGDAYSAFILGNDTVSGFAMFLNSSTRTVDGGTNTATIRNDAGSLYLKAKGDQGLLITTQTGTAGGNVKLGGTADRATTVGTNHIDIFNGTAPAGTLANGISLYSSGGEAYVMDAAGNATLFSPHDSVTNEWIFRSKHTPTGKVLRIDVEKMLRFINDHFGLDMIQEFTEE